MTKVQMVINLLQAWKGRGEIGANNSGWFVDFLTKGSKGAWCAALIYTAIETVWYAHGEPPPISRTHGAKRLTRRLITVGKEVKWDALQEGDVVCWNRGRFPWQGHVGLVTKVVAPGLYMILDGNVGKKAKVRERLTDLSKKIPWKCARLDDNPVTSDFV